MSQPQWGPPPANSAWSGARPAWPAPNPQWQPPPPASYPQGYGQPVAPPPYQAYPPQPYQAYPPQPGWGAPVGPPTSKPAAKKSWLPVVIILVAVFVIGIPIMLALASGDDPTEGQTSRPTSPSTGATTPGGQTAPGSETPGGPYSPGPPELNPDDPPEPTTYRELYEALENNPLYSQSIPTVACGIDEVDLAAISTNELEQHLNDLVECLMYVWYEPVKAAGFYMPRPSVTVYTQPSNSPCGQMPMHNAFYCAADQQIYYAENLIEVFPDGYSTRRFLSELIIAHEFGHGVQYRTMILFGDLYLEQEAETEAEAWEISRRTEMQADCFAGLAIGSVAQHNKMNEQQLGELVEIYNQMGSQAPKASDHGMIVNRQRWFGTGAQSDTAIACNTWVVPAEEVD